MQAFIPKIARLNVNDLFGPFGVGVRFVFLCHAIPGAEVDLVVLAANQPQQMPSDAKRRHLFHIALYQFGERSDSGRPWNAQRSISLEAQQEVAHVIAAGATEPVYIAQWQPLQLDLPIFAGITKFKFNPDPVPPGTEFTLRMDLRFTR